MRYQLSAGVTIGAVALLVALKCLSFAKTGAWRALGILQQALDRMRRLAELRRSRWALLSLGDERLRDIGLTRRQAEREGQRSLHIR